MPGSSAPARTAYASGSTRRSGTTSAAPSPRCSCAAATTRCRPWRSSQGRPFPTTSATTASAPPTARGPSTTSWSVVSPACARSGESPTCPSRCRPGRRRCCGTAGSGGRCWAARRTGRSTRAFPPVGTPPGPAARRDRHGTPLKLLGHDRPVNHGKAGFEESTSRYVSRWDHLLAGNPHSARAFRSAWFYEGPVHQLGYPRNDALAHTDPEHVGRVRERLGIREGQVVVLYAPPGAKAPG